MRARELLDPNFGKESQLDEGSFAASRTGLQDEPLAANHRRGYRRRRPRNSVVKRLSGTLQSVAMKEPGFGDRRKAILDEIAILTNGRAITERLGMRLETV